jgi:hypothetical protein
MPEFTVRSDSVDVEQIMEQIRARIRDKRGVDYTDEQIRELASVKLEKFLDPRGLRSDLLDQFRRVQKEQAPLAPSNFAFEDQTLYDSHRGPVRAIRRLLQPVLKLFFNPNPLIQALHIQSQLNTLNAERETTRRGLEYEVLHNLVVETTRLGIEVRNLKMRVESLTSRLEFNERRARALESVVVYKPQEDDRIVDRAPAPVLPAAPADVPGSPAPPAVAAVPAASAPGPGQRSRRRRRRRGRRSDGPASAVMGVVPGAAGPRADGSGHDEEAVRSDDDRHTTGPDQTGQEPADDAGDAGFDDQ